MLGCQLALQGARAGFLAPSPDRHITHHHLTLAPHQGELLEGDNAYLCEELGRRVPALKRACIKALPHTLVIHLKRFEFDYHSQTRFKVGALGSRCNLGFVERGPGL